MHRYVEHRCSKYFSHLIYVKPVIITKNDCIVDLIVRYNNNNDNNNNKCMKKLTFWIVKYYNNIVLFVFIQEEQNIRSNGGNKRKMPPHPIRIAKTIDVIARITFPTAYAVFLIFFFIHYTSHPSHWSQ